MTTAAGSSRRPRPTMQPLESRQMLSAALPRQVENLDRGVVVMNRAAAGTANPAGAYVGWRLLGLDPAGVGFNVYRSANGAAGVKLNAAPITNSTNYVDTTRSSSAANAYWVRPVVNGVEGDSSPVYALPANTPVRQYLSIPIVAPPGGTVPDVVATNPPVAYTYSANDVSTGDLDGDGDLEFIVKWDPSNAKDNSQAGYTGNVFLDAYTMQGTRLWRVDLGRNIRAGAHYTQFQVYDLDGDGKAEVATKTADATVDGVGTVIGNAAADHRNGSGYVLSGPEFLTVFDGLTGAARATVPFQVARGSVGSWGDTYGNRVDRFLAGVAYLDGKRPSLVFGRGYYARTTVTAWDFRDGTLTRRWAADTANGTLSSAYAGQGAHSLSIADVDADGRDEVVYGAMTLDDDGRGLYSSGFGHGDALHVSDMDPDRPGLEVFQIHESESQHGGNGGTYRDGRTGALIHGVPGGTDVGRGVAFDVDPRTRGYEMWTSANSSMYDADGNAVGPRPSNYNFGVWWDADPLRELLNDELIDKWNPTSGNTSRLLTAYQTGAASINGTKATPALSGDLFGDWREEVVWPHFENNALLIYTTTITATTRLPTLLHDTMYRSAVAWQNTAYNQPPHPSFYLVDGMATPPAPNVYYAGVHAGPADVYQAEAATLAGGTIAETLNGGYNGTAYANPPTTGGSIQWSTVDGRGGGAITARLRYALGGTTARTGRLLVNGVAQDVTFPPTGAFTTWATLSVPITLNRGAANVVRLESTGQDLANVDELRLEFPVAPVAATGLTARPLDASRVELRWTDAATDESGYRVLRSTDGKSYELVTTLPAGSTSYVDGGRAEATAYQYRIVATNLGGDAPATAASARTVYRGDADLDGTVGFADLLALSANYGRTGGSVWAAGDFDGDGVTNFADLLILAGNYGRSLS